MQSYCSLYTALPQHLLWKNRTELLIPGSAWKSDALLETAVPGEDKTETTKQKATMKKQPLSGAEGALTV